MKSRRRVNSAVMLLQRLKLGLLILTCFCLTPVVAAKPTERTRVLRFCTQTYGAIADQKRNLFSISEFYVLRLSFDRAGWLTELAVEPRYYYDEDHPDWAEPDNFPYLSKAEYDRLVAEVDRIKPKGPLVKPASLTSVVTNMTARRRQSHRAGILEWGELVDLRCADDAPLLVKWFRVYYSKRAT